MTFGYIIPCPFTLLHLLPAMPIVLISLIIAFQSEAALCLIDLKSLVHRLLNVLLIL